MFFDTFDNSSKPDCVWNPGSDPEQTISTRSRIGKNMNFRPIGEFINDKNPINQ